MVKLRKMRGMVNRLLLVVLFLFGLWSEAAAQEHVERVFDVKEYEDYFFLHAEPDVGATMDTEAYKPICKLPKKQSIMRCINRSNFAFFYSNRQVILIDTNLLRRQESVDTCFTPSIEQIGHLTWNVFYESTTRKGRYLYEFPHKKESKTLSYN